MVPPGPVCFLPAGRRSAETSLRSSDKVAWRDDFRQSVINLRDFDRDDCRAHAWLQFGRAPVVRNNVILDLRFDTGLRGNFTAMPLASQVRRMSVARHELGRPSRRSARPSTVERLSRPAPLVQPARLTRATCSDEYGIGESATRRVKALPAEAPSSSRLTLSGWFCACGHVLCSPHHRNRVMTHDDNDPADPVLEVLTEYEQKLRTLHQNDRLAEEAQRTFGALVNELERRSGVDRRKSSRAGTDRRIGQPRAEPTSPSPEPRGRERSASAARGPRRRRPPGGPLRRPSRG